MTNQEKQLKIINHIRESLGYGKITEEDMIKEYASTVYVDQDGILSMIFMKSGVCFNNDHKKIMFQIYNNIFGTGDMCMYRSRKWRKRLSMFPVRSIEIEKNPVIEFKLSDYHSVEVSILTVASIIMNITGRDDERNIFILMSRLTYWLDSTEIDVK